ncbi:MAG TPA: recombinase RecT [Calditerricola sp.]
MAVQTDAVRSKLARKQGENGKPKTIFEWLRDERFRAEIERAIPRHLNADRLLRITMTVLRQTPELGECSVHSLLAAVLQCAQLGLEPGVLGHVYLVPFKSSKLRQKLVQVIIGYKGLIELARRSGQIESISARLVYANDEFEMTFGIQDTLRHVPWYMRDGVSEPGPIRGGYSIARFRDGGYHLHYLPIQVIEQRRKRSRAADEGPWKTDYEAMCLKTVVRDAAKWWPLSAEVARGLAQDESVKRDFEDVDSEAPYFGDDAIDVEVAEGEPSPEPDGDADSGGDDTQVNVFRGEGQ